MSGAFYIISPYEDSNYNQAMLEHLYRSAPDDFICMQIYTPCPYVSIGRNMEYIEQVTLPINRRLCGGDYIQLRSSCVVINFIAARKAFDLRRQSATISLALKLLNIDCIRNSNNEILLENGKEACLNIYDMSSEICRQMVIINTGSFSNVHTNLPTALTQYGVNEYDIIDALENSFKNLYKIHKKIDADSLDKNKINEFYKFFCSNKWLGTVTNQNNYEYFSWGRISIDIVANNGIISDVRIYSNSNSAEFIANITTSLVGCTYLNTSIKNKILSLPNADKNLHIIRDILRIIESILNSSAIE